MYAYMVGTTADSTSGCKCDAVPFDKMSRSKGLPFYILAELEHMSDRLLWCACST